MIQPPPEQDSARNAPPTLVEWHPTPKYHPQQQGFGAPVVQAQAPAGQPAQAQWWQAQQPLSQNYQYPGQAAPQAWIMVPVPASGYTGTLQGNQPPGAWQQLPPAWPSNQQNQPTTQPQYQYQPLPQGVYAQRPWGQADDHARNAGKALDAWPRTSELPAWSGPVYGGWPAPNSGYYGTYPGAAVPGYVW